MTNEELRSLRASALESEREIETQRVRIEAEMQKMLVEANLARLKSLDLKEYEIEIAWPPVSYGKASPVTVDAYEPPIPGLHTEIREDQTRCASCSKMILAGERMAWLPDHLRKGDGLPAFVQAVEASNRSGNWSGSGWCMSCVPHPAPARKPVRVWEYRWSFEWILLHTVLLPFLLLWRLARLAMAPARAQRLERPDLKPVATITTAGLGENDDAVWCRLALAADPDMTDAAGVPLQPLVDRDLPDLAARRDAMIAADPTRRAAARAFYDEGVALIRAAIEEGVGRRNAHHDSGMDEKLRFLSARHPGAADAVRARRLKEGEALKREDDRRGPLNDPNDFFESSPSPHFDDEGWN